jgi:Flp pilus assembly protein TadD
LGDIVKKLIVFTVMLVLMGWCSAWGGDTPDADAVNAEIEKLLNAGRYQHVIDTYAGLHLNDAIYQNRLGYAHDMLGNYDSAIWYYRRAVELAPDEPLAWRNLGVAYKSKGDIPNALVALQFYADMLPAGETKAKVLKWIKEHK